MKKVVPLFFALSYLSTVSALAAPEKCPDGIDSYVKNVVANLKIESSEWIRKGFLRLNSEELERLKIAFTATQFRCEERTYKDPKRPETEVSLANEPQTVPPQPHLPRIIIGLKRYQERSIKRLRAAVDDHARITYFSESMLFFHDLLGIAEIPDHHFENSGPLRESLENEWNQMRGDLTKKGEKILRLASDFYGTEIVEGYKSTVEDVFKSPEYQKCIESREKHRRDREKAKLLCGSVLKKMGTIATSLNTDVLAPLRSDLTQESEKTWIALNSSLNEFECGGPSEAYLDFRSIRRRQVYDYLSSVKHAIEDMNTAAEKIFEEELGLYQGGFSFLHSDEPIKKFKSICPAEGTQAERAECFRKYLEEVTVPALERAYTAANVALARAREEILPPSVTRP